MTSELAKSIRCFFKSGPVSIETTVFRLHYRATVSLLIASASVGVAKQYFGDPINCQTASGVSSKVIDDYCWIHSTFHIRQEFQGNVGCIVDKELLPQRKSRHIVDSFLFDDLAATGNSVFDLHAPSMNSNNGQPDMKIGSDESNRSPDTSFYQWVPIALVLQAMLFYLPHRIWKSFEGGFVEAFGCEGRKPLIIYPPDISTGKSFREARDTSSSHRPIGQTSRSRSGPGTGAAPISSSVSRYAQYFHSTLHNNNGYFFQYLACELMNVLIDVVNLYVTDIFLDGRFLRYGIQAVKYYFKESDGASRRDIPNPMCTVFPTVTSCTFHSVGTAAGEQKFNSLCVLSLNIVNEKVYLILWFWFVSLTCLTCVHVGYRLITVLLPKSRSICLLIRTQAVSKADRQTIRYVLTKCSVGDWWLLYQICRNTRTQFFRRFLVELENRLAEDEEGQCDECRYHEIVPAARPPFAEHSKRSESSDSNGTSVSIKRKHLAGPTTRRDYDDKNNIESSLMSISQSEKLKTDSSRHDNNSLLERYKRGESLVQSKKSSKADIDCV